MKKSNLIPLIGIALVVAIASTGIFYGLFVGKLRSNTRPTGTQPLVVTAKELSAGTVLSQTDVKTIIWPADTVPQGSYGSAGEVVGATVIEPMGEGEPVLATRIASSDGKAKAGPGIPAGFRAVSVHVTDSTGVLSLLRPGHQVDVQVVALRNGDAQVRTVLQHLTVLTINPHPEPASQGRLTAPVVTLLALPGEADVLAVADAAARVRLLLRNPLDQGRTSLSSLTLTSVLRGSYTAPATSKRAERSETQVPPEPDHAAAIRK